MNEFYGLYRGIVRTNDDSVSGHPHLGRIKVFVPQVYGQDIVEDDLPWAEPCFPLGGGRVNKVGYGIIAIPPVNATVWIMFEQGDPAWPVWLGTWFGERDIGDGVSQEMPDEAVDGYPDTVLVFRGGMYIRIEEGSKIEVVSRVGTHVILHRNGNVEVETDQGDVSVEATAGKVQLVSGQDLSSSGGADTRQVIEMDPTQAVPLTSIRSKRLSLSADSVELQATGRMTLRAEELGAVAATVSGFEKH